MKKRLALLVVVLSSVTLHAQTVWTEENIDPDWGLRTGTITVNGDTYTIFPGADLSGANLSGADLSNAFLDGASLREAFLDGANLSGAGLYSADLFSADLSGADLSGADLFSADLSRADFTRANLSNADLTGASFEDTELTGSTWNAPDPRIAELEAQLAAAVAERDAAIQERDARYTEEQIRALSPDYTMGLNEAGNVEVKISFIASSDATNFAPFPVTADSLTVIDGKICMELPPDEGAFFYRFRIE